MNSHIETFSNLTLLKNWISEQIRATPLDQFPIKGSFQGSISEPTYTITIETQQPAYYVDCKGTKWIREK
jgi:hypothetical protein